MTRASPAHANAPTGRPRRSNDDGCTEDNTTEQARQYRMYAPGAESLASVLARVLYGLGPDGAEVEQ